MKCPPMMLLLKIPCGDGKCHLWLPWFLVYFILLALTLVALPFVLLLMVFLLPLGKARFPMLIVWLVWQVIVNLQGLQVEIGQAGREMSFSFV